jgi:hypothetical protein
MEENVSSNLYRYLVTRTSLEMEPLISYYTHYYEQSYKILTCIKCVWLVKSQHTTIYQRKIHVLYRMIQEELPPFMVFISDDILSKKCHINLSPILNIYSYVLIWIFSKFQF